MAYYMEYNGTRHRCSPWLKNKIKSLEKIEDRTHKEEYELLLSYSNLLSKPFPQPGDVTEDQIYFNNKITELCLAHHKEIFDYWTARYKYY